MTYWNPILFHHGAHILNLQKTDNGNDLSTHFPGLMLQVTI